MLRFDANLYRIAMQCSSKEETRYYLQGVFVEPHAVKGVTMTATDGHRLICIHNESGIADESAIVLLSAEALKACKPVKYGVRCVVVEGAGATVQDFADDMVPLDAIAISAKCRIDGTFPDWRRVVPQNPMVLQPDESFAHFSGDFLASMGTIGVELEKQFGRFSRVPNDGRGLTQTLVSETTSPALVLWHKVPEAFGVLMPVRAVTKGETAPNRVPAWLNAKASAPAPVLEAAE